MALTSSVNTQEFKSKYTTSAGWKQNQPFT